MIRVKKELHYPEGHKPPANVRRELLDHLIEGNALQLAAAAWQMHGEYGRGMLVLRINELSAPISAEQDVPLVNVPYVTLQDAPPEAGKVSVVMQNYDPLTEMMVAVAFPEGELSFFIVETDPSPPAAEATTQHVN